jgi:type VI secretion system secreted protein VgrG
MRAPREQVPMPDSFTISSATLPKGARVVGFRGSEGISRLYAFEIYLELGPEDGVAFELPAAVGAKAKLVADPGDGRPPFVFNGIFSEAALVHNAPDGGAVVRAVLVPRLWQLTQTLHSRIFTQQSIPDILKKTLEDGGLTSSDYSFRLTGQYQTEEHVCQYRESGFAFFSRWMEREGLYYYFEHGDDGEKLVVADDKSAHENLGTKPVRFSALAGYDASAGECLQSFVCKQRALPASVRLKDYDHTKPSLDVSGSATVSASGVGEISVQGARFFTPDDGKRLAKLRAEELLAREQVFTGSGTALFLRAGYTFDLVEHPRASFDAKYLATEVEHWANQGARTPEMLRLTGLTAMAVDEIYRVEVTAIAATVQFRAEPRAVWPRIYGTEHGIVDGEADSDYAQLDEHGRYFVRFAFDESDLGPGKASTRVRMMQPHGGDVEGWHFPLRKGTEVLFTFLGGDPDRPVIAGVVPNTEKPSPITKANQTRNVIQTGGRNRLEIEDKKGFERITLTTPFANTMIRMGSPNQDHALIIRTDGKKLLETGDNLDITVLGELTEEVVKPVTETYLATQTTTITGARTETIKGGGFTHTVAGGYTEDVTGDFKQDVHGNLTSTVSAAATHTISGGLMQKCANLIVDAKGYIGLNAGGPFNVKVGDATVTASSWTVNSPLDWFKVWDKAVTVVGNYANGLITEGFVVHTEHTGIHYEITGLGIEATNTHVHNTPSEIVSGGIRILTFGLTKM